MSCELTDADLTRIYNQANNIAADEHVPITTQRIFTAMRAGMASANERADYAWRNANTIEKARQEEMAKRDKLTKSEAALKATIISLLEILRQWEPDWSSGEDRRTIVLAMYQVGILIDPTAIQKAG